MAELRETAAVAGLGLPVTAGAVRLVAAPAGQIVSIAPWPGQGPAVAARLGGFPAPGGVIDLPAGRLVWAGRDMAFLFAASDGAGGIGAELAGLAAVTDQSDGWAGLVLDGEAAPDVLARLVPLDLAGMAAPAAARSLLNHMPLLLVHPRPGVWELWSYRSMAGTMVHELEQAMRAVAARRETA